MHLRLSHQIRAVNSYLSSPGAYWTSGTPGWTPSCQVWPQQWTQREERHLCFLLMKAASGWPSLVRWWTSRLLWWSAGEWWTPWAGLGWWGSGSPCAWLVVSWGGVLWLTGQRQRPCSLAWLGERSRCVLFSQTCRSAWRRRLDEPPPVSLWGQMRHCSWCF